MFKEKYVLFKIKLPIIIFTKLLDFYLSHQNIKELLIPFCSLGSFSVFQNETSILTLQKFRDFLATLRETAVKEQEVAISQAIANIIKNKQHQESQGYWRAISLPFIGFCAGMLMIGLAAGLVSGLAIAKLFLPTPSLNAQSARDLAWVASDNGKLARNLVDWNQDILKTCLQDQQNLKEDLIILNGKYVTKGLCALWVLPETQRVYEDRR